jgi:hypothetical protein
MNDLLVIRTTMRLKVANNAFLTFDLMIICQKIAEKLKLFMLETPALK